MDFFERDHSYGISTDIFYKNPVPLAITVPENTRVMDVNDALVRQTGYKRKELLGKTAAEVGIFENPSDRLKISEIMKQFNAVRDYECRFNTRSGSVMNGLVSVVIIHINGSKMYLSSIIDITSRVAAEARIKDQLEELRRWHEVILNRENRIIELKQEINELLILNGKSPKYNSACN
jgi:PAS domain S-box-containing protein